MKRAEEAVLRLADCALCAQVCRVNLLEGELGVCRAGRLAVIASCGPHYGEEDVLVRWVRLAN
ncbi:MAG: hypothetical protein GX047_01010 [Firmicutes bacterium]|nr:hypothetical protein [Bacillota bacterium]